MLGIGTNGGLIGPRRVPSTGNASGVWDPEEQKLAKGAGVWPVTGGSAYRYWRFANFADTPLNSNTLDLTEIELRDSSGLLYGITITANFSWEFGAVSSMLNNAEVGTYGDRMSRSNWSNFQSTATLTFDFATPKTLTSLQIFSLYTQPRFPASFDLQFSSDGTTYSTHSTVTVGTSFTDLGNSLFASSLITL
jgi:hypothetical protein